MTIQRIVAVSFIGLITCTVWTCSPNSSFADEKLSEGVVFEKGIEYSNPDDQHLQLNMARPTVGTGPFPAIVCIHGGGFRAGKRDGFDGLCVTLAQHGYVAVTVTYRLAPNRNIRGQASLLRSSFGSFGK